MTMRTGGKLTEHLSVGILGAEYPLAQIRAVLAASDKHSERVRLLPSEVMAYYVIALGLLMTVSTGEVLRVLREGLGWLGGAGAWQSRGQSRHRPSSGQAWCRADALALGAHRQAADASGDATANSGWWPSMAPPWMCGTLPRTGGTLASPGPAGASRRSRSCAWSV